MVSRYYIWPVSNQHLLEGSTCSSSTNFASDNETIYDVMINWAMDDVDIQPPTEDDPINGCYGRENIIYYLYYISKYLSPASC
jgi:hypothetical protein